MIYDYKCLSCKNEFQLDFPISTKIRAGKHIGARCPVCRSKSVRKKIHKVEIRFRGNGFYITDNPIDKKAR